MRRPPHIEITMESPSCALVTGYGAREAIMAVTKRPPVWATISRAWVIQPGIVRDLVAIIELRGWDVTVVGETGTKTAVALATATTSPGEEPDPGHGLW